MGIHVQYMYMLLCKTWPPFGPEENGINRGVVSIGREGGWEGRREGVILILGQLLQEVLNES